MTAPRAQAVAIVTGGSSEFGGDVARTLAGRGFAIVVVYLDDQDRADATVDAVFAAGSAAVAVRADLADELDVRRLFDETIAVFGAVDVVVDTTSPPASVLRRQAEDRLGHVPVVSVSGANADGDLADPRLVPERRRRSPSR
jgi:3-oxoacyl-[acyl-carrier protein] reductase